jgi:hypothetical protein
MVDGYFVFGTPVALHYVGLVIQSPRIHDLQQIPKNWPIIYRYRAMRAKINSRPMFAATR